jgi:hypothetical protein
MLRFLTPTEAWRERVSSKVSLPGEWPVMLVEIFHTEDGQISMTCALGVPKSSLKAFLAQGAAIEAQHAIFDGIFCGKHENRDVETAFSKSRQDLDPIAARQHAVQHDQIEWL